MLLEREAELETLGTALDAAREGRGSLLVIEGHAGLGKSQLLAAARGFAKGCGVRALSAAGSELERDFAPIARDFVMEVQFFDSARKTRAVIMVSKFGHALVDLLYRVRIGAIAMDVPLIVSNHRDLQDVAEAQNIPFVHLPVTGQNKMEQEARTWKTVSAPFTKPRSVAP